MEVSIIESKTLETIKNGVKEVLELSRQLQSNCTSNKWLDNQEVCLLLGISLRTLQNYRDKRIIPFSQIGYKCYYKASDIEQFIEQLKNKK
ncbi:helix-turn-helix domain-containing protein [Dysgonomonas sp. Marseille-P4677]|uniref:helix-turn-helix domain-containing protein n=1 Tax=Dysgonomonas sp. Marseille-P4677 TaxID=2364790 RepID=UPI001912ADAA|nr:helix-turn-helix domain-containing protein [Dysgonomonas sp. Marseille-P4677]MBK5719526.1 helix-turn-helix domain-containing protein [Dysgonomonas sp. Marseille-P4677]